MQTKQLSLGVARWIALAIYLTGLVVYPVIGMLVKVNEKASPETLRILPLVFLGLAVVSYVVSLVVESLILGQARAKGNAASAASAAIVTSAFGESIAILGLILALLGAGAWSVVLYALCAAHGLHLMVRWPNFELTTTSNEP